MVVGKFLSAIRNAISPVSTKKRRRVEPDTDVEVDSLPPAKRSASSSGVGQVTGSLLLANNKHTTEDRHPLSRQDVDLDSPSKPLTGYSWKRFPPPTSSSIRQRHTLSHRMSFIDKVTQKQSEQQHNGYKPQPPLIIPPPVQPPPFTYMYSISPDEGREALQLGLAINQLQEEQKQRKRLEQHHHQQQRHHAAVQTVPIPPSTSEQQHPTILGDKKDKGTLVDFSDPFYSSYLEKLQDVLQPHHGSKASLPSQRSFPSTCIDEEVYRDAGTEAQLAQKKWQDKVKQMRLVMNKAKVSLDYLGGQQRQEELQKLEQGIHKLQQLRLQGAPITENKEEEEEEEEEEEGIRVPLPSLSKNCRDTYKTATAGGRQQEVLVTHPISSIELRGRDMEKMRNGVWLNDELINFYVSLLLDRDARRREEKKGPPTCHIFSSYFLAKLYKDEGTYDYNGVKKWTLPVRLKNAGQKSQSILDCDRIIIPVNQGNMHWVCALIDLEKKRFVYYDSLGHKDETCLKNLAQYIKDEYKNKRNEDRSDVLSWPRLFPKNVPQQQNGCDCGVFTILFADYLSQNAIMDFNQKDIPDFRVKIVCDMLRKRVD